MVFGMKLKLIPCFYLPLFIFESPLNVFLSLPSSAGHPALEARAAALGAFLPGLHLLRGRYQDVGPVVGAAGVHGHQLGLRLLPRLPLRRDQPAGSAGGRGHGPLPAQGRHRMRDPLRHRVPTGEKPDFYGHESSFGFREKTRSSC